LWCPGTHGGFDKFQSASHIRSDRARIQLQKERLAEIIKQPNTIIMAQEMEGSAFTDFLNYLRTNSCSTIQGEYQECQRGGGSSFGVATFYNAAMFKQERDLSNTLERSLMHKFTTSQGNTFYAWNAHLKWIGNDPSKATMMKGILQSAFTASQSTTPKFIFGDFNFNLAYLSALMPTSAIYIIENGALVNNTNTPLGFHFNTTDGLIAEFPRAPVGTLERLLNTIDPTLRGSVCADHLAGQFSLQAIQELALYPQYPQSNAYLDIFERDMVRSTPNPVPSVPQVMIYPPVTSFNWGRYNSFEECLSRSITGSLQGQVSQAYQAGYITQEDIVTMSKQAFRNQAAFWSQLKAQRNMR
jgi:hypothetical protein